MPTATSWQPETHIWPFSAICSSLPPSTLIAAIWQDDTFSDEAVKQITQWAIRELVPSHPKTLGMRGRSALEVIPKAILGQFLIQAPLIQNAQRANLAVRTVAVALDMEPDDEPAEYLKVITETINGF